MKKKWILIFFVIFTLHSAVVNDKTNNYFKFMRDNIEQHKINYLIFCSAGGICIFVSILAFMKKNKGIATFNPDNIKKAKEESLKEFEEYEVLLEKYRELCPEIVLQEKTTERQKLTEKIEQVKNSQLHSFESSIKEHYANNEIDVIKEAIKVLEEDISYNAILRKELEEVKSLFKEETIGGPSEKEESSKNKEECAKELIHY